MRGGPMTTRRVASRRGVASGGTRVARQWTEGTRSKLEKSKSTFLRWRVWLTPSGEQMVEWSRSWIWRRGTLQAIKLTRCCYFCRKTKGKNNKKDWEHRGKKNTTQGREEEGGRRAHPSSPRDRTRRRRSYLREVGFKNFWTSLLRRRCCNFCRKNKTEKKKNKKNGEKEGKQSTS